PFLLRQMYVEQHALGLTGSVPFIKKLDRPAGDFSQPLAEAPRLERLGALVAAHMDGQADDESFDLFFVGQLPKIARVGRFAATRVVYKWACEPLLVIRDGHADPHCAIVNARQTACCHST